MEHTTDDERARDGPSEVHTSTAADRASEGEGDDHNDKNAPTTESEESNAQNQGRKDRPISGVVPPYWRHHRAVSRASLASVDTSRSAKPAITLEDHSEDPNASSTKGLWAKNVTIDDYTVVSGKTGIGAYVVWLCKVQTLDVRLILMFDIR